LPKCWRPIFLVLPKLYGCQIGLPNCWSCSKCTQKWILIQMIQTFSHMLYGPKLS
jgi:hypothetical protein